MTTATHEHNTERMRVLSQRDDPQSAALLAGLALLDRALTSNRSEASAANNGELPAAERDERDRQ